MQETETPASEKLEIPKLDASRNRILLLVVALALVAVAIGVYFLTRRPEGSPYRSAQVTEASIVKEIRVTGSLELTEQVEVPAPVKGQLVEVVVRPGDEVEEGQLLARLDKVSAEVAFMVARSELQVARANVSEAEASTQRASRSLARSERLAEKGLASASALEAARSETSKARAALRAARAERSAAEERASLRGRERDQTEIVSPRAGLVLEVPPHTGMVVGPQTRLFRIGAPLDEMRVVAPIGEADISEMSLGLTAKFEVPTHAGRVFEAKVEHISPDPMTEHGAIFYRVKLSVENEDHALLPGMTAQVRIKVAQVDDVLAVREATLRFTPEGAPDAPARSRVWRVRGTELEEVPVEVGLSDGALTEVRPAEGGTLQVDEQIAIGLALDGDSGTAAPSLSLRGHR
ncbi:MAG: efflux RND transporter periplasmic adaptor subunit [Polyangiales bacterium]